MIMDTYKRLASHRPLWRRIKITVGVLLVLFLVSRSAIVCANFPTVLWLGADACSAWKGKNSKMNDKDDKNTARANVETKRLRKNRTVQHNTVGLLCNSR
ncbi:hypothetical protein BaRGS_00011066, partial [Batillaria attramentaria]